MSIPAAPKLTKACLVLMAALLLAGCGFTRRVAETPASVVNAVLPSQAVPPGPAELQQHLLRFADTLSSRTDDALAEYARMVGTPQARLEAQKWALRSFSDVTSISSGPNPFANLIDLLTMVVLTRSALEDYWVKTPDGRAFEPWLTASRALEKEIWGIAEGQLTKDQQAELRDSIKKSLDKNPDLRQNLFGRPAEYVMLVQGPADQPRRIGSVFALIGLDPLSGVDPAVREIAHSRLFAERLVFVLQRMPSLARLNADLLVGSWSQSPYGQGVYDDLTRAAASVDRASRVAESISRTAARLPLQISAERRALVATFDAREGQLRSLSEDARQTILAGQNMSASLNTTLLTFDALMKRFGIGEPSNEPPTAAKSPPFDILNYARTAEQLTAAAHEIDLVLKDLNGTMDSPAWAQRMKDVQALASQMKSDARSVLNYAFVLAAILIVFAFACALAYRRFAAGSRRNDLPTPRP